MATGVVKMVAPSLATSIRGSVYPLFNPCRHTAPISPNAHQVGKSERLAQSIFSGRPARLPIATRVTSALISANAHQLGKNDRVPQKSFARKRCRPVDLPERGSAPSYLLMHNNSSKMVA